MINDTQSVLYRRMKSEQTTLIFRGVMALGRRLRAERPQGAPSLPAISILGTLRRLGPMPARRLATEERLQPQSLTRLIGDLESKGWIVRTRSEVDRREISIELTALGKAVFAEDMRARRIWLEHAIATTLTDAEQAALIDASEAMLKLSRL